MLSQLSGNNVSTYTMTWGQAKLWLKGAIDFMRLLQNDEEFGWRIKHKEEGKFMTIECTNQRHSSNTLFGYGNAKDERNAQNLRGTGPEPILVNLDEGLFFADGAYEVILPVVANGAGMVITSSLPPLNSNALGLLQATLPDGQKAMKV